MTDWEPTEADIQWTKNTINILNEGGAWGVPGTGSAFTFYHSLKKYKFMGDRWHETTQKTFKILEKLEWQEMTWN